MTSVQRADISQLLSQMRDIKSQIRTNGNDQATQAIPGLNKVNAAVETTVSTGKNLTVGGVQPPSFTEMFQTAVDSVNSIQKESGALSKAYELGDPKVDITQVMVASQKSGVAFEAAVQVRNKVVSAYQDVMNMPI